jgi:adenosine kinase
MQNAGEVPLQARPDLRIAIIAPDGREAMWNHARQLSAAGIPFIFDPGQQLPMFDGPQLQALVDQATWVAVNDYEGRMLCERTGHTLESLSRSHLAGVVVTLGAEGCDVWAQGRCQHVPGVVAEQVIDPTGCGDAFRGALLYGLERGWPLTRCVELGNRVGALKIACRGGQNHSLTDAVRASLQG